MKNIIEAARERYTTKHYDSGKILTAEQMRDIKELLRLAPSSVNSQPWHFIIASTPAGKARMAKSTVGMFDFNKGKILEASHTVLFCARRQLDEHYLQHLTDKERQDGRFGDSREIEEAGHKGRVFFAGLHAEHGDVPIWTAKQSYLNIGAFLLGIAAMGIDATAIEGFAPQALDEEFGLKEKGLQPLCLVSIGHRAAHDSNASRPKSRLEEKELITEI